MPSFSFWEKEKGERGREGEVRSRKSCDARKKERERGGFLIFFAGGGKERGKEGYVCLVMRSAQREKTIHRREEGRKC